MPTLTEAGLQALERRRSSLVATARERLAKLTTGVTPPPVLTHVSTDLVAQRVVFRDDDGLHVSIAATGPFRVVEHRESGTWGMLGEFSDLEELGRLLHSRRTG